MIVLQGHHLQRYSRTITHCIYFVSLCQSISLNSFDAAESHIWWPTQWFSWIPSSRLWRKCVGHWHRREESQSCLSTGFLLCLPATQRADQGLYNTEKMDLTGYTFSSLQIQPSTFILSVSFFIHGMTLQVRDDQRTYNDKDAISVTKRENAFSIGRPFSNVGWCGSIQWAHLFVGHQTIIDLLFLFWYTLFYMQLASLIDGLQNLFRLSQNKLQARIQLSIYTNTARIIWKYRCKYRWKYRYHSICVSPHLDKCVTLLSNAFTRRCRVRIFWCYLGICCVIFVDICYNFRYFLASRIIWHYLENLGPKELLIRWLHEGGELNLVGASSVYRHLVLVTVHLIQISLINITEKAKTASVW